MKEQQIFKHNYEPWRILVFYIVMGGLFLFVVYRLFSLQILQGIDYLKKADINRTTEINVQAQRGIIYDRNGVVLARNVASFNVVITPAYLPSNPGAIQEIYRQLSELINVPVNKGVTDDKTVKLFKPCQSDLGITQIVYIGDSLAPYDPVPVKCNVSDQIAMVVREKSSDWLGVSIAIEPVRDYPTGVNTAEVIGFLGPIPAASEKYYKDLGFLPDRDKVGYAGIEATLQDILGGKNGTRTIEVDGAGKEIRDLAAPVDPVPGYNIKLTIDTRLQTEAKHILQSEIDYWQNFPGILDSRRPAENGVVIAMNPKTGEILALVSYPTFENNRMARLIPGDYYEQLTNDPFRPLFNHAISAEYPPGSVYKLGAAIGALNEGVVTLDQTVLCPSAGKITVMQKFYPNDPGQPFDYKCWRDIGHGDVDFLHAIAFSCDVWFYKISGGFQDEVPNGGLGVYRMSEYALALGYGQKTGIELPGEADGLVPTPEWKRRNVGENWATGDTYIASMGQGYVLATPLQVLRSFAVLANDGKSIKPTLIKEILDIEDHVIPEVKDNDGNIFRSNFINQLWDITIDPLISIFDESGYRTEKKKIVDPLVVQKAKEGMRLTVTEGTGERIFYKPDIPSAGKTGTAEYCDDIARKKDLCSVRGSWPTHSWYVAYAPYDDPEIVVVAFVYNGGEGASVAGPIVNQVINVYFSLKALDSNPYGQ